MCIRDRAKPIKLTFAPSKTISSSDLSQKFYAQLPKNAETDAISERILQTADAMGLVFELSLIHILAKQTCCMHCNNLKVKIRQLWSSRIALAC